MIKTNALGRYIEHPVGGSQLTVLDYSFDFSEELDEGETIVSHTFTCEGLACERESVVGAIVTVFVVGGEVGKVYLLTCTIVTDRPRIIPSSLRLYCVIR